MGLLRNVLLWGSENEWMREKIPQMNFSRHAVKRFMPGENLEDALAAAQNIQKKNMMTIFTYLGENIKDLSEAEQVVAHYLQTLEEIEKKKLNTEISLKLTHIGLDFSLHKTFKSFCRIAKSAHETDNFVWIDIEGSAYTETTIKFYKKAKKQYSNVGLCLQAYLIRTEKDIANLIKITPSIRLVKGAYNEPANIAYKRKSQVDQNFKDLSIKLLKAADKNNVRIIFGTHDANIISFITKFASVNGIDTDKFEFHLLYGIKTELQEKMANAGYNMGVLISYGEFWFPWYMRRLAERPANVGFVLKNIFAK